MVWPSCSRQPCQGWASAHAGLPRTRDPPNHGLQGVGADGASEGGMLRPVTRFASGTSSLSTLSSLPQSTSSTSSASSDGEALGIVPIRRYAGRAYKQRRRAGGCAMVSEKPPAVGEVEALSPQGAQSLSSRSRLKLQARGAGAPRQRRRTLTASWLDGSMVSRC